MFKHGGLLGLGKTDGREHLTKRKGHENAMWKPKGFQLETKHIFRGETEMQGTRKTRREYSSQRLKCRWDSVKEEIGDGLTKLRMDEEALWKPIGL